MCYDQSEVNKMDIKERNLEIINLRKNGLSVNEIARTCDLYRGVGLIKLFYSMKKKEKLIS